MTWLDRDHITPDDDKGPHYDPVRLIVDVTIDRTAFPRSADAQTSAAKVLDDAVYVQNTETDLAHSVTVVEAPDREGYADNEWRARIGEYLLDVLESLTGVDREGGFSDAVAYLLHAEMLRRSEEEGQPRQFGEARDLLDMALDSFAGDREDGPYAWEEGDDAE